MPGNAASGLGDNVRGTKKAVKAVKKVQLREGQMPAKKAQKRQGGRSQ